LASWWRNISKSEISWGIPDFPVIGLHPDLLHSHIHFDPPLLQIIIEIGFITGKFITLEAEIHLFFLVTSGDPAIGILAVPTSTSPAIALGELLEYLLEFRIMSKHRPETGEPFGIVVKISKSLFQATAMGFDITLIKRHTLGAVQTTWGQNNFDLFIIHNFHSFYDQ